jgi:uncharacterized membrane protein YqjE
MSASQYPGRDHAGRAGNGGDAIHSATPVAPYASAASTTPPTAEGPSVATLLRQLTHDVPELVVKELALARGELTESMRATKAGIAAMVGGGAVLLSGLVVLLMSGVYALSNVVEPWLAALLVGGVVVVIGLMMVMGGKKKLEPGSLTPDRTLHQMHKDKDAIRAHSASTGRTA